MSNTTNNRRGPSSTRARPRRITTPPITKRPTRVTVTAQKDEVAEKLIKRFLRKVKKEEIIETYRENEYHKKPSVKKREKRIRAQKARNRAARKNRARQNKK